jgi:hypothetical protein
MWNTPTKERLARIPKLYETEETQLEDKLIHLHFFLGGCDWYISEYDGDTLFWGFACLNGDLQNAEWGYVSFAELQSLSIGPLEIDCELEEFWQVKPAKEIELIRKAMKWEESDDKATEEELRAIQEFEEGSGGTKRA